MAIDSRQLGQAIKSVRMARGLTQAELAAAAGLASVSLIEQGRRSVSMETLDALAEALHIPAACLVVLGTRHEEASPAAGEFVSGLQELISAVVLAQSQVRMEARAERSVRKAIESEQKQFSDLARMFRQTARKSVKPRKPSTKAR